MVTRAESLCKCDGAYVCVCVVGYRRVEKSVLGRLIQQIPPGTGIPE